MPRGAEGRHERAAPTLREERASPRILPRQRVVTRDGLGLCTDVYLPAHSDASASVLIQTPYGRHLPFLLVLAKKLNQIGLAAVLQDSRGRYQSEGVPDWEREYEDGFDTLAWMGGQSWCNGSVGLLGMSISSRSNIPLATLPAPDGVRVAAMLSIMGAIDFHSMFYDSGAVRLHWALPWCHLMGSKEVGRNAWRDLPWAERFRHLPLTTVTEGDLFDLSLWRLALSHPEEGGFWDEFDSSRYLEDLRAPTLFLSGWYDFMLGHSLRGFGAVTREKGEAAHPHKVVLGPWDHSSIFRSFNVAADSSDASETSGPDLMALVLGWFATWLGKDPERSGSSGGLADQPSVLLHVMQSDRWLAAERYPLQEATNLDWYLASDGGAEALRSGRLVREPDPNTGYHTFEYDPENPQPTEGGSVWPLAAAGLRPGPAVQSQDPRRQDFLRYDSDPLDEDLVVVGPVALSVWASTSARDTDFTAKLVDVDAGGIGRIVQDGIVRGRFCGDRRVQTLLEPHRPTRFEILLGATAYRFRRGHRLRLEVSSSNFPKYDRNLNTGGPLHSAASGSVAYQTVFHGGEMRSRLRLPVISTDVLEKLRFDSFQAWSHGVRALAEENRKRDRMRRDPSSASPSDTAATPPGSDDAGR